MASNDNAIDLVAGNTENAHKKRAFEDESISDAQSNVPPANGSKRLKVEAPAEPTVQVGNASSVDEGEIDEKSSQNKEVHEPPTVSSNDNPDNMPAAVKRPKTSKKAAGWNPGINKVVMRTSLKEPVTKPGPAGDPADTSPTSFQFDSLTFKVPGFPDKREGSWFDRFLDWVRAFHEMNPQHSHAMTPKLALAAYTDYIDNHSGLKNRKKRSAKQASKELESTGKLAGLLSNLGGSSSQQPGEPKNLLHDQPDRSDDDGHDGDAQGDPDSESESEYEPSLGEPSQPPAAIPSANDWASLLDGNSRTNGDADQSGHLENGQNASRNGNARRRKGVPDGAEALEQQRLYFTSASDPTNMCLSCGAEGHIAVDCPGLTCRFCGSEEHSDMGCPSRIRCQLCKQLGHLKNQCVEKLALTKDEGLACAYCDSPDHLEEDCTAMWRSFHPTAENIKKVRFIPASCSLCGSDEHFSADCTASNRRAWNPTWSLKNRDQYVDPNSTELSIFEAGRQRANAAKTSQNPELKIRGHATRRTHIHYSESDDSEVEFLGRAAVRPQPQVGQIRMASNIQMPRSDAFRGNPSATHVDTYGKGKTPVQPPLPPGPPPPMSQSRQGPLGYPPPPGVSTYGSQPTTLPHPLPPKPPQAPRDYRHVPPPLPAQPPRGQGRQSRDTGNSSQGYQGRSKGSQRGGRGGRGGGRGKGRGRGK